VPSEFDRHGVRKKNIINGCLPFLDVLDGALLVSVVLRNIE
jgi:hypothetical protein